MAATTRGAAADAASTDDGEAPRRMVRALNRVRDVLEPVGETLAVVSSVLGIVVGAMEIVQDVRYIVDSARGTLAHGGGGAVDLAGDALSRISNVWPLSAVIDPVLQLGKPPSNRLYHCSK
jgi:hypothetical protein